MPPNLDPSQQIPSVRPVEGRDVPDAPAAAEEEGGHAEERQANHAAHLQGERQTHFEAARKAHAQLAGAPLRLHPLADPGTIFRAVVRFLVNKSLQKY